MTENQKQMDELKSSVKTFQREALTIRNAVAVVIDGFGYPNAPRAPFSELAGLLIHAAQGIKTRLEDMEAEREAMREQIDQLKGALDAEVKRWSVIVEEKEIKGQEITMLLESIQKLKKSRDIMEVENQTLKANLNLAKAEVSFITKACKEWKKKYKKARKNK